MEPKKSYRTLYLVVYLCLSDSFLGAGASRLGSPRGEEEQTKMCARLREKQTWAKHRLESKREKIMKKLASKKAAETNELETGKTLEQEESEKKRALESEKKKGAEENEESENEKALEQQSLLEQESENEKALEQELENEKALGQESENEKALGPESKNEKAVKKEQSKKNKAEKKAAKKNQGVEEKLLSDERCRRYFYEAYKYALEAERKGCEWGKTAMNELEEWVAQMLPRWHRCIKETVQIDSRTKKKCREDFTKNFDNRLRENCKNVEFYDKIDLTHKLSASGVDPEATKKTTPKVSVQGGDPQDNVKTGSQGVVKTGSQGVDPQASDSGALVKPTDRPETDRKYIKTRSIGAAVLTFVAGALTVPYIFFGVPAIAIAIVPLLAAVGVFATLIAFLVCKHQPREKLLGAGREKQQSSAQTAK